MTASPKKLEPQGELGEFLRYWRDLRGKSQFDVALDTGISQRHISFIESGRSVPSRQRLLQIASGLDVPLRDRNVLLLAAGYAPVYPEAALDAPVMQATLNALRRVLRQHEPFMAVVMDRYWNVIMANDAAPKFFGKFIDLESRPRPRNLLHLMFDPKGMRPYIANWEAVARSLFERIHRESVGRALDEKTQALLTDLLAYPGVKPEWKKPRTLPDGSTLPVIPLTFTKDGHALSYSSLVTTVGAPQTTTTQELRIECMYPADEATEAFHPKLMKQASRKPAR